MDGLVIPSRQESEYLLHALEACLDVTQLPQLFLWSQTQLQALLPHRALVCTALGSAGEVLRAELLEGAPPRPALAEALRDPAGGLLGSLMAAWQGAGGQALPMQAGQSPWLSAHGLDNVLAHGTGMLPGGGTFVVLCDVAPRPGARQAHFLRLLMPHLHLALQRIGPAVPSTLPRPLSAREKQVLLCLRDGKTNAEIAAQLGLSALTVKNHLHRLYRVLGVGNRAHAVARSQSLHGSTGYWSA